MEESQDLTDLSFEEARATLRKWREEHVRRSEETLEIWEHVLSRYSGALNDELWVVLEQVVIAALDCSRHDLAIECLQVLNAQFPKSSRVTKLQALRLESLGKYEDADYLYDKLLESDETNGVFRKRKIASLIGQGMRLEAIHDLNEYLHNFINDSEAWAELAKLYLQEMDFARGIFCFEELLLSFPHNGAIHCHLAELRYTLGGSENIEHAKLYYEKAVKLNVGARAYYGIILCCNSLLAKCPANKKRDLINSGTEAADKLLDLYSMDDKDAKSASHIKVIQMLKSQLN